MGGGGGDVGRMLVGYTVHPTVVPKILKNSDRHETTFPMLGKVNWFGKKQKFRIPTMASRATAR